MKHLLTFQLFEGKHDPEARVRRAAMTPEERAEDNIKRAIETVKKSKAKRLATMTPEEMEAFKESQKEAKKQWARKKRASMTPEEKEERNSLERKRMEERMEEMSDEEREEFAKKERERAKEYYSRLSPEEKEEKVRKTKELRDSFSPEEKEAFDKKAKDYANMYRAKTLAQKAPGELTPKGKSFVNKLLHLLPPEIQETYKKNHPDPVEQPLGNPEEVIIDKTERSLATAQEHINSKEYRSEEEYRRGSRYSWKSSSERGILPLLTYPQSDI